MSIGPGSRLGPYEITALIGEGGMGKVWRAHHTALKRDDALKVLPDAFASDPERLARFRREAQVLASLNHPNIAHVHGLEQSDGVQALVMELVEGPTLADRIARGPIQVDEALPIAKQIAEALEAAHEQGIIHRDLKPANVKVRPDGTVKVLDFGLAKALEPVSRSNVDVTASPTVTSPAMMTGVGMLLGTAAYMSPEQARGKAVDKRSDIWAFGCVLYEMLSGRRAFAGDEVSDTLAFVLTREPNWGALPQATPSAVRRLLRRSLEKERKRRLPDIADARLEIDEALDKNDAAGPQALAAPRGGPGVRERLAWGVGVLVAIAMGAAATLLVLPARDTGAVSEMRLEISTPPTLAPFEFALSPDARYLAFVAAGDGPRRLWLRALDQNEARPVMGTEGAFLPFWSADSHSVGFFAGFRLHRVDIPDGQPQALTAVQIARGGTWNADGTILFSTNAAGPLMRIQASGGDPIAVTRLGRAHIGHRHPHFLPDGRHFLFYAQGSAEVAGLYLGSLDDEEHTRLTFSDGAGVYLPPDRVVFSRQGTLVMRQLDLSRRELVGAAATLSDSVGFDFATGVVGLSASSAGHVAYRSGGAARGQLIWFDRSGQALGPASETDATGQRYPALSPDGRHVAVNRTVQGNTDIWVLDLGRGGATRFTFDASSDSMPVWSSDGARVTFVSSRNGAFNLYWGPANQPGTEELLLKSPNAIIAQGWSNDGRFLLYYEVDPTTGRDLKVLELSNKEQKTHVVANTRFEETLAEFSPDGRWIAYQTDQSGRFEIVVKPFPPAVGQLQVSTGGGVAPRWRADGKELYFIAPDGSLMAAAVTTKEAAFEVTPPSRLFSTRILGGGTQASNTADYAVARDGRFLVNQVLEESPVPITLILNAARAR